MKSVVVYGSRHGNTERVARAITFELAKHGEARAVAVEDAVSDPFGDADLVLIGGPTEAHGVTQPVKTFLEALKPEVMKDRAAAAFDTRLHGARWLTGAAGDGITRWLRHCGVRLLAQPESFFVSGKEPRLMAGELERATVWAAELAALVERAQPVMA